jgi:hypothetical protein
MAADVIDLTEERARRRPPPKPVPPPAMPAGLPPLCALKDVTELFRCLEAQIG